MTKRGFSSVETRTEIHKRGHIHGLNGWMRGIKIKRNSIMYQGSQNYKIFRHYLLHKKSGFEMMGKLNSTPRDTAGSGHQRVYGWVEISTAHRLEGRAGDGGEGRRLPLLAVAGAGGDRIGGRGGRADFRDTGQIVLILFANRIPTGEISVIGQTAATMRLIPHRTSPDGPLGGGSLREGEEQQDNVYTNVNVDKGCCELWVFAIQTKTSDTFDQRSGLGAGKTSQPPRFFLPCSKMSRGQITETKKYEQSSSPFFMRGSL